MSRVLSACIFAATILTLASCNKEKFHVTGEITGAKDSILYFQNMSLKGPVVIDSLKLSADGKFDFSEERQGNPEFYILRIANQVINISIDSTETVTIKADYATMPTNYSVEGSYNCKKIKELSLMQIKLQNRVIAIQNDPSLSVSAANDSSLNVINSYKDKVKREYIFKEPNKAYAYFAVFQTVGDYLIFNPRTNREDIKAYAAVATSWDTYYPNSERTKNLHNIAIEGMKDTRIMQARQNEVIDASKVQEAGIIDIALEDNKGVTRHLSDLKGKVVMLDFHVFATDNSPQRIMALRDLYNKYHNQGFEIYQVSLDSNEHFWKTQTAALPWISVRDEDGINSQRLSVYNIQRVPTFFLIDRNSNLRARDEQVKDLNTEIAKLLAE